MAQSDSMLTSTGVLRVSKRPMSTESFYHSETGVSQYTRMADGYDGAELIDVLSSRLATDMRVLELGMGPGKDLDLLGRHFRATGSDFSPLFLRRYLDRHPEADVLELDAVTILTDRHFDGIYSNKVLHHLEPEALLQSVRRQREVLGSEGVVLHSFWYGSGSQEHAGMMFHYYDETTLQQMFEHAFNVVSVVRYAEMEEGDSVYVLAERHGR